MTYTAKDKSNGVCEVVSFKAPGADGTVNSAGGGQRVSPSERTGQDRLDARAPIPCAQHAGQPSGQCQAAVARDPGGTATAVEARPDGHTRAICFEKGKAIGADLSQADGSQHFRATKSGDVHKIDAGHERYEIIEALVFRGLRGRPG